MANANEKKKKKRRKMKRLDEIVGGENVSEKKALIEGTCDDWIEGQIMDAKKRRHGKCWRSKMAADFKGCGQPSICMWMHELMGPIY